MKIAIITGSAGLIGSQATNFLHEKGFTCVGIDNDMRSYFFGSDSSTKKSRDHLEGTLSNYEHYEIDIRDYNSLKKIYEKYGSSIEIIIHTAAQPSHDWASNEPMTDFSINALGTLNLLELTRINCPNATFIFTSTNKVYGDRPNLSFELKIQDLSYNGLEIIETPTRWEGYFNDGQLASIDESMPIDNCKHSIFGASKVAADIMCQEYGKYFGLNVGVFRGGCLTGPNHAGTELHGFLSYLVKCIINDKPYKIFGYKGKQVRDNIHSWDLVNMFWNFHLNPKPGEVYNAGGGRENSISILEAIEEINLLSGKSWDNYEILDDNRIGDHIWYITDLKKFQTDYPEWSITMDLKNTLQQMIDFELIK